MALIKCPECEKEISDQTNKCVHCGYPISKQPKPAQEITPKESSDDAGSGIMEEMANAIKVFLKNKRAVKRTIIIVAGIVLAIIVACTIYDSYMEKLTLEQIEEHIENKEYEYAFDRINSGYISDKDIEKYREIVVPHMQEEFANAKKSEREYLSLIVAGTEYFIYDGDSSHKIYTKEDDERNVLYDVPQDVLDNVGKEYISWSYYLDSNLSMYANGCIFFIEEKHITTWSDFESDEYYVLKYLNLNTGVVKEVGSDEYFRWMYKLEDGSIFVQYSYYDMQNGGKLNPRGGIRYNPFTQTMHEGDNVVTEEEIENAVYKCKES